MNSRDIVAIGASAGGVEALKQIVSAFPPDFDASVFVVLHVNRGASLLPEILSRAGPLPASQPDDGDRILPGHIYVAPPDYHLLVQRGHVHLSKGPRENRSRPAVDPLFRSAAIAYGARVIGVVLTGALDDGTMGLWEIKRYGGIAVVQDPADSAFPSMPKSALASVPVDYSVSLQEMGQFLVSLTSQPAASRFHSTSGTSYEPTRFTCPDCHGPLERIRHGDKLAGFVCRVGHAYSPRTAVEAHADAEERALWGAIENLEEGAELIEDFSRMLSPAEAEIWRTRAEQKRSLARSVREMVTQTSTEVSQS